MKSLACVIVLSIAVPLIAGSATTLAADDGEILQVVNRAGFGARPGDVEKVRAAGIQRYVDEQLHPDRIPDTSLERRLAGLETLRMSATELAARFGPSAGGGQSDGNRPITELAEQQLLRAVYSERQLQEVLVG